MQDPEAGLGDSKASLAFSNMLREQIFNQDNPPMEDPNAQGMPEDASQMPQDASGQAPRPEPQQPAPTPETTHTEPENDFPTMLKEMEDRLTKKIDEKESTELKEIKALLEKKD